MPAAEVSIRGFSWRRASSRAHTHPHDEAITDLSPRLLQLRADVERATGRSFNAQAFHDFVLSQGLLPPTLMREAVMARFAGRK